MIPGIAILWLSGLCGIFQTIVVATSGNVYNVACLNLKLKRHNQQVTKPKSQLIASFIGYN